MIESFASFDILKRGERQGKRYSLSAYYIDTVPYDAAFRLDAPYITMEPIPLGRLNDGSFLEGFIKYLELLEIHVDEENCAEIVEVFDLMQRRKTLLQSFDDLHFRIPGDLIDQERKKKGRVMVLDEPIIVRRGKEDIARKYRDVIQPPEFSVEKGIRRIRFWMADRHLEQWEISEDNEGGKKVKGKVVEKYLVF